MTRGVQFSDQRTGRHPSRSHRGRLQPGLRPRLQRRRLPHRGGHQQVSVIIIIIIIIISSLSSSSGGTRCAGLTSVCPVTLASPCTAPSSPSNSSSTSTGQRWSPSIDIYNIYRSIYTFNLYLYFRWSPPQQLPKTLLDSTCTTNRLPADEDRRMESQCGK